MTVTSPFLFGKVEMFRKWPFWIWSFVFWTLIAVIFTTKTNLYYTLKGISTSWLHLSIHHMASAWVWVVLTPLIYIIYQNTVLRVKSTVKMLTLILLVTPLVGFIQSISSLALDTGFRKYMGYISGSIWDNLMKMNSIILSNTFDGMGVFLLMICFFIAFNKIWRRNYQPAVTREKLRVKHNGKFIFIEESNLIAVTAEGNYMKLHVRDEKPLMVRQTMVNFMEKLNGENFIRVNRSLIANTHYIKSLHHKFNGEYVLELTNGIEANTSKRYGDSWKQLIS